jgi:AcrR family transcriptional regulator
VGLGTKERLIATAGELFYRDGIVGTGVDAIAAAAEVSKPTLYARFGSKAGLVAAVLEERAGSRRREVVAYLRGRSGAPRERMLAAFDWLGAWHAERGGRGCTFLNAAAELVAPDDEPAREVVRRYKRWWRTMLSGLAREAGVPERRADELASHLLLLLDGASARVLVEGDAGAASDARRAAAVLIDAALA